MGFLNFVIAVVMALVIWRVAMWVIAMLSTPPLEVDPQDVISTDQHFRCTICGTEVTMTIKNVTEEAAPKHCREEMVHVWRP
jgi:hypothetical protein